VVLVVDSLAVSGREGTTRVGALSVNEFMNAG
jgi:hypothetical protein